MDNVIIERQVQRAIREAFGDKGVRLLKGIRKLAAKQGGENAVQNYQLLGKRTLVAVIVAVIAVEAVTSTVGYVISRRNEDKRIETIVRRVLEEEGYSQADKYLTVDETEERKATR